MMKIEARVRDYRGCERADIDVDPIALLAGRNGSGKTSYAQAIASVLTGDALPMRGIAKGNAGQLVRFGRESGAATVQTESGTARIDWPACTRRTENHPPEASRYAVGLASVAEMPPAERARVLAEYLKVEPTREDLSLAISDHPELDVIAVTAGLWEAIEKAGWDRTLDARRERGAEDKGRWRQVTGANYGSRIAASWRRDLDDERRSDAELVRLVEAAKVAHERAIASSAAAGADRAQLRELADDCMARSAAVDKADETISDAQEELRRAVGEREGLPPATTRQVEVTCPECGSVLVMRDRSSLLDAPVLEKANTPALPAADLKARRLAIAEADGIVANKRDALSLAQRARGAAEAALRDAQAARRELEALPPETSETVDTIATRTALDAAQHHLADVRAKRQADEIAKRIAENDLVIDILAPDGLRGRKLGRIIEAFNNSRLAPLCTAAGWREVAINQHFELTYGGRHYMLLSQSEQFRVRVVLQVAMAQLDASAAVIIDGADILDGPGRGDLVELLVAAGIPAIICMTLGRRDLVPDLAAAGYGRAYWLDEGIATPIEQQAVAA